MLLQNVAETLIQRPDSFFFFTKCSKDADKARPYDSCPFTKFSEDTNSMMRLGETNSMTSQISSFSSEDAKIERPHKVCSFTKM